MRIIFALLFVISFILFNLIHLANHNLLSLFFYALYLTLFILFLINPRRNFLRRLKSTLSFKFNKKECLILGTTIIVYLSLLFYFSTFKFHYQEDEFITAYISFFLPSINKINWFALFPLDRSWVTQFPILFFILQKPFLTVLGPSLESIRVSTWPYQILTVLFTYLIGKEYFKEKIYQYLVPVFFIMLAPNLYLSSLGLHFISSTAFFLASFYFFLRMTKEKDILNSILCGIFIGASYLTYASSYTILPFLIIFIIMEFLNRRNLKYFTSFLVPLSIFLLIFYPFLLETIRGNSFLITRINQVSIFQPGDLHWIQTLNHSLWFNLQALYTAGLGGVNEYYFGHQALFNPFTFLLIIVGLLAFLLQTVRKNIRFFYPLLIIVVTFFLGMVLTIPPGAFHRIYISFPFVALVIVGAVKLIAEKIRELKILPKSSIWIFLTFVIVIFPAVNFYSTKNMINKDEEISILTDSVYIQSFITANFPKGSKISIAAYPAYHLGKELFFRLNNSYPISTDYFPAVLSLLKPTNLLIIQYPNEGEKINLLDKFPKGEYLTSIGNYHLKYHAIFIPK